MSVQRFFHNNSLTIAIFAIFLFSVIGMSVAGWLNNNETLTQHHQPEISYGSYLASGDFIEGVFENWESEFLQMWALIILTVYLRQKGSADSKPMRGAASQDTSSRYSIVRAATWSHRAKAARHLVYSHSLSLALFTLFAVSFALHAAGGYSAHQQEAMQHSTEMLTFWGFLGSSEFWYQSLQNWQSEFLAIGTLIILSIKLRERGSTQSKPVGKKFDHKTGS